MEWVSEIKARHFTTLRPLHYTPTTPLHVTRYNSPELVHCTVLHPHCSTALYYTVQCSIMRFTCTALHFSLLHDAVICAALFFTTLYQHCTVKCSALNFTTHNQHCAPLYYPSWRSALHNTSLAPYFSAWCSVLHYTALREGAHTACTCTAFTTKASSSLNLSLEEIFLQDVISRK